MLTSQTRHLMASLRTLVPLVGVLALGAASSSVRAQGAQPFGLQLSVLSTTIRIGSGTAASGGIGIEPQLRFNRLLRSEQGVLSLGLGGQWTTHTSGIDEITITGGFVEPRWVPALPYERVFPYLAGRVAVLNQSNNFGTSSSGLAYGAGGGLAFVVNTRLNIDAGVTLVRQQFGDITLTRSGLSGTGSFPTVTTYAAKIGFSLGLGQ
jgi:hypothetical protein